MKCLLLLFTEYRQHYTKSWLKHGLCKTQNFGSGGTEGEASAGWGVGNSIIPLPAIQWEGQRRSWKDGDPDLLMAENSHWRSQHQTEDMIISCIKNQQQHEVNSEAEKRFCQREAERLQYSNKQEKKWRHVENSFHDCQWKWPNIAVTYKWVRMSGKNGERSIAKLTSPPKKKKRNYCEIQALALKWHWMSFLVGSCSFSAAASVELMGWQLPKLRITCYCQQYYTA